MFDLKDVAQEVKDRIRIIPVVEMLDVLKVTGLVYSSPNDRMRPSFVFS